MEKTFLEIKVGDPIYFVNIEKSELTNKKEINTATVTGVQKTLKPYELEIALSNSIKIYANWNVKTYIENRNITDDISEACAINQIYCTIYSTSPEGIKNELLSITKKKLEKIYKMQDKLTDELLNMSLLVSLSRKIKVIQNAEVVAETVIV